MSLNQPSRQSRYVHWLTKDPNGPGMKRVDTRISAAHWKMFVALRDSANLTQQEALEYALGMAYIFMVIRGKISHENLTEACFALAPKTKKGGPKAANDPASDGNDGD